MATSGQDRWLFTTELGLQAWSYKKGIYALRKSPFCTTEGKKCFNFCYTTALESRILFSFSAAFPSLAAIENIGRLHSKQRASGQTVKRRHSRSGKPKALVEFRLPAACRNSRCRRTAGGLINLQKYRAPNGLVLARPLRTADQPKDR